MRKQGLERKTGPEEFLIWGLMVSGVICFIAGILTAIFIHENVGFVALGIAAILILLFVSYSRGARNVLNFLLRLGAVGSIIAAIIAYFYAPSNLNWTYFILIIGVIFLFFTLSVQKE